MDRPVCPRVILRRLEAITKKNAGIAGEFRLVDALGGRTQGLLVRISNSQQASLKKSTLKEQSKRTAGNIDLSHANDEEAESIRSNGINECVCGGIQKPSGPAHTGKYAGVSARDRRGIASVARAATQCPALGLDKNERDEDGENVFHGRK